MTPLDEPWKEALHRFFPDFGELRADTLVRAPLAGRSKEKDAWVLVHVEMQAQVDRSLPLRTFRCHYRIFDRHGPPLIAIAVLGDANASWRPRSFGYGLAGTSTRMEFLPVKRIDWESRWSELESVRNPFAPFVMAHLKALRTRPDARRLHWKWTLTRGLFERGLERQDVLELVRLVVWVLALPPPLELKFRESVEQYQQETKMPFMTWWEQKGHEIGLEKGLGQGLAQGREQGRDQGREEGLRRAIERVLGARFAQTPADVLTSLEHVHRWAMLERLVGFAAVAPTLDEFRARLAHDLAAGETDAS